jgi:hypothetical protein
LTVSVAIVGGGMAGLELATSLASCPGLDIEVFERGPFLRCAHIDWDTAIYAGDEKTRRWTAKDWGEGGGLSERLGGRSLCYHGILLEIESAALAAWPQEWTRLLAGQNGVYRAVSDSLRPEFPELETRTLSPTAVRLGMKHVPQAAYFESHSKRLRAYSALPRALRLAEAGQSLRITRAAAHRLRRTANGSWCVDLIDADGNAYTRSHFQCCVLAASAITNITLLSQILQHELTTRITDHLSVGVLARLPPGNALDMFRHRKLWSGYIPVPALAANIFVQERAPLYNNDRLVELFAVIEQGTGRADYSELRAAPAISGHAPRTSVTGRVSTSDRTRLIQVKRHLREIVNQMAEGVLDEVKNEGQSSARYLKYDDAYHALTEQQLTGTFAWFDLPYGSFEHEACSHPIGSEGALAVTPHLEVESLPGLYLAGPGTFVRPGAANPALTILAMSRILADIIRATYV